MSEQILIGGQDIGRRRAYTALVILVIKEGVIYVKDVIQWPHVNFDAFESETISLYKKDNLSLLVIDASGMGEKVLEDYQKAGIRVEGIKFTDQIKSDMLNNLLTLITGKKLKIHPKFTELLRQMKLQQMKPGTSHTPKYTEPSGDFDDQLWALCLACWGAKEYMARPELVIINASRLEESTSDRIAKLNKEYEEGKTGLRWEVK